MPDTLLHLLSGGAAQGLVRACAPDFEARHGVQVHGTFGAVGAMKARLREGVPCDVLILTAALIDELGQTGHVRPDSARALGVVHTGVAVKQGQAQPDIASADGLRAALLAASGIYFPDPQLATAGIHFMKVLQGLGIADALAARLRTFPNGATAMQAMADCDDPDVIGCTQVTEILITPGIDLIAELPPAFALATVYTAAITQATRHPALAADWIAELSGATRAAERRACGFVAP